MAVYLNICTITSSLIVKHLQMTLYVLKVYLLSSVIILVNLYLLYSHVSQAFKSIFASFTCGYKTISVILSWILVYAVRVVSELFWPKQ